MSLLKVFKVIIADDEELARKRLKRLLSEIECFKIIGEACNGLEAIDQCKKLSPDLIFLDIEMPGKDGLSVAKELGFNGPKIIFVTGYDEYALKAFESNSVDYLVKPIKKERLADTVAKLTLPSIKKIPLKIGNDLFFIDEAEIKYIISDNGYSKVVTKEKEFLTSDSLETFESHLSSNLFMRIHRGIIVNLNKINSLKRLGDRNYQVSLLDKTILKVSRNNLKKLTNILENNS
jgi:two-component system LytT family response regulator